MLQSEQLCLILLCLERMCISKLSLLVPRYSHLSQGYLIPPCIFFCFYWDKGVELLYSHLSQLYRPSAWELLMWYCKLGLNLAEYEHSLQLYTILRSFELVWYLITCKLFDVKSQVWQEKGSPSPWRLESGLVFFHIVWTCWAVVTFVTKMSDWYDMLNPYVCSKITILWCLKFAIGALKCIDIFQMRMYSRR